MYIRGFFVIFCVIELVGKVTFFTYLLQKIDKIKFFHYRSNATKIRKFLLVYVKKHENINYILYHKCSFKIIFNS